MTQQEAFEEARKRWGESAYVKIVYADSYPGKMYRVLAQDWMPMGSGDSWEAAFADADRRANVAALQKQVSALRDALNMVADDAAFTSFAYRHARAALALTQPAEVPATCSSALAKMSPQLRNVLYNLIRKVPPLADHGDQQALNEFIAEVKP